MKNGPYTLIKPPAEYPGKRYRGRYAYEHRVQWWQETGLNPDNFSTAIIHHCNEQKRDNRATNLALVNKSAHKTYHHTLPKPRRDCLYCDKTFTLRRRNSKQQFCSRPCVGYYNHKALKSYGSQTKT